MTPINKADTAINSILEAMDKAEVNTLGELLEKHPDKFPGIRKIPSRSLDDRENLAPYNSQWITLAPAVLERAENKCEFCGNAEGHIDVFHRWFPELHENPDFVDPDDVDYRPNWDDDEEFIWKPEDDTPANLMALCANCHNVIHVGGKLKAFPSSLAARGDNGSTDSPMWREYLASKTLTITL